MKISARTRYGLRILLDIAQHERDPVPRTIAAIAAAQGISAAFISRLAVPLKRAGLLHALRGAGGGLRLAKSPEDISVLSIAEALDGPVSILACVTRPKTCKRYRDCFARSVWADLNLSIKSALADMTLAKVMDRLGLRGGTGDYCI
jgi:Rrf2 family protein